VLHKEIPFLRIGLPICAGIVTGLYYKPEIIFLSATLILIISGFTISLYFNKLQTNLVYGASLTVALFLSGLLLYRNEKDQLSTFENKPSTFTGTVSDYLEEKENSNRLIIKLKAENRHGNMIPVKGSVLVYIKKGDFTEALLPGDILTFSCTPVAITNRGNPYEFDYRFFMENQGIRYFAFMNGHDIIKHVIPSNRRLAHNALITREKIIDMYRQRGIRGERLALVSAITLGQKRMLDPDQKMYFMKAGVMHIMAVSGLHAIILSMFVLTMLFFMKRKFNILRIVITIAVLWGFAFVTGLTPSVLRATIMFSFLQAGKLMKRPSNGINSVLASAVCLILVRPSVIFDAGFLLSYSAVIFIISFYHDFYLLLQCKSWLADKIWQSAAVTIIAQAGTLPLTIMLFNRFPTYFILANITIVPISNLLIITGCMVPLLFHITFLSKLMAVLLNHLTGLTEKLTMEAASLPYSTIENIGLTVPECILLSCTIFLFTYYFLKKKSIRFLYPVFFVCMFIIAGTARDIFTKKTNQLLIYNTPGASTIGIRTGKILTLYSDTTVVRAEVKRHCAVLGLKIKSVHLNERYDLFLAAGKKILVTSSLKNVNLQYLDPDIIVLTGSSPAFANIPMLANREVIVVQSGKIPEFAKRNIPPSCSIFIVRSSGAYVKRI
jgi:competence protein ComEC